MAKVDLVGKRFGRLTVIAEDGRTKSNSIRWKCICDCGNIKTIDGAELRRGHVASCGCFRKEKAKEDALKRGIKEDLSGRTFSNWTVIKYVGNEKWECKCKCGAIKHVKRNSLVLGKSTQCTECSHKARAKKRVTHGDSYSKLYKVYHSMHDRCENKNAEQYKNYGSRGIKVCDEWSGENGYVNFREWAYANGYNETAPRGNCSIDRIDVNGHYEPSNCKWSNSKEQANNMRRNIKVNYNGETKTIAEWAEETGKAYASLSYRIKAGWDAKEAIELPSNKHSRFKRMRVTEE